MGFSLHRGFGGGTGTTTGVLEVEGAAEEEDLDADARGPCTLPSQSSAGTAARRPSKAVRSIPDQFSQTFSTAGPYTLGGAGGAQLELVAGAELLLLVGGSSSSGSVSRSGDGSLTVWPSATGTMTPPKLARPPPGPPSATAPTGMMMGTAPETSTTLALVGALEEGLAEEAGEEGAISC